MLAKLVAQSLQSVCNEFLGAGNAPKSLLPGCKCPPCVAQNKANHFLITWQMALQICLQSTNTKLNQIFVSRSFANHRFTGKNLDLISRLAEVMNLNQELKVRSQWSDNKIQTCFEDPHVTWQEFYVEFVIVDNHSGLSDLWDLKRISTWASLSYCPNSESYLLNRSHYPQMCPELLPMLDRKVWNPNTEYDIKQLLFLHELSSALNQDLDQGLLQKIASVKETVLIDCSAKDDLKYFSQQMTRFASCDQSFSRLIDNFHLLQVNTDPLPVDREVIQNLKYNKNPHHRLIGLFYLFNGIQKPTDDEAGDFQQAKIYRNFELLFAQKNLWRKYLRSLSSKALNDFQEVRLQIEFAKGLTTALTSDNFHDSSLSSESDLESALSQIDENRA